MANQPPKQLISWSNNWYKPLALSQQTLPKKDFWIITGIIIATVGRQAKLASVHPGIGANTTHYERVMKQEAQKQIIWDWDTQESVGHLLMDRIIASVDYQYLDERNINYTGFSNETTETLITYIR